MNFGVKFDHIYTITLLTCSDLLTGQARLSGPEEGQVPPIRGRPHHSAGRVQLVEEQQVLQPLVLRKLCANPNSQKGPRCPQTDVGYYGQVKKFLINNST